MVSAAARNKVQSIIDENPVAVFSKSYCPYCRATKDTLRELGIKPFVIELDIVGATPPSPADPGQDSNRKKFSPTDDGSELQDALHEISGQRTVPNIYIKKEHIGGNSDLQGKADLPKLLKAAGAVTL
ncbi:Glutaredoxin [Maublancomyces gigas]|uniref:Glutaredoxin n=1 Tax=Discina gigas TaxID=1032678 RepID=A0ABR3GN73_9PEZI